MNSNNNIYASNPLRLIKISDEEIPVFSHLDDYVLNYEKISADHMNHMNRTGENPFMVETFWSASEEQTRALLLPYLTENTKILDVGVGLGRLLEKFPNHQRYGMDISTSYLPIAKQKGIDVCFSKIEDMPYRDNSFDIVICTDVLEHVLDLKLALDQIYRVLKTGGVFIMRVPYKEDLQPYLDPEFPYQFVHLRSFDESTIRLQLEKIHGFNVVELKKGPYIPPFLNPKLRILGKNWRRLLRILSGAFRIFGDKRYRAALAFFHDPLEIDVVARKHS